MILAALQEISPVRVEMLPLSPTLRLGPTLKGKSTVIDSLLGNGQSRENRFLQILFHKSDFLCIFKRFPQCVLDAKSPASPTETN